MHQATSKQAPPGLHVASTSPGWPDCRLCGCKLIAGTPTHPTGDDLARGVCRDCVTRPEAVRFGVRAPANRPATSGPAASKPTASVPLGPRAFNAAEKSLIRACTKSYMPAAQLLDLLNNRLIADLGEKAVPFTMEQLWDEAKGVIELAQASDWTGLRQIIGKARKSGVLATITPQLIDDFSTVFQLSAAQRMTLHDVIRNAQEGR